MSKNQKIGLEGLLRPEDSILVLIDHQPYQFTNLNSHEPTMIINKASSDRQKLESISVINLMKQN